MAAKKSKRVASVAGKRKLRSSDEIIADLQAEIRRLRERQKASKIRSSPPFRAALAAIRALDKALDVAAEENESSLRHALADARKALAPQLERVGIELPKANLPKGRRPRE